jgi:hypothetical protein
MTEGPHRSLAGLDGQCERRRPLGQADKQNVRRVEPNSRAKFRPLIGLSQKLKIVGPVVQLHGPLRPARSPDTLAVALPAVVIPHHETFSTIIQPHRVLQKVES